MDWESYFCNQNVDNMTETFYNILNELISKHVPTKSKTNNRFPFWYASSTIKTLKEKYKFHKNGKFIKTKMII